MPEKRILPTDDIMFQEIFGRQKNKEITARLLTLILGREIKEINLDINKQLLGNRYDIKESRLDVRAKFADGEDAIIEMQVKEYAYMPERLLVYWAKVHSDKLSRGKTYETLKPTISILITDYELELLKDIKECHTKWKIREEKYHNKILTNNFEMHVLELKKIEHSLKQEDRALIQWLRFLGNPEDEEVKKFMEEDKFLKQAMKEYEHLKGEEGFRRLVEARADFLRENEWEKNYKYEQGIEYGKKEGIKEGKKEGIKEGIEQGIKEKAIETAKKMIELNIEIDVIEKVTGLTEDEIKTLKKK